MTYTQLKAFFAVAEAGGFNAASRKLGIGQPTLSTEVRALEQYFGVELFHRRGRGVMLTDFGRQLLRPMQRMFAAEAEAIDLLKASQDFRMGSLKVGAVGPYHVTEMLAAFKESYPEIEVTVSIGNSQQMRDELLEYRTDVAVLAHTQDDPRFFFLPYSRHPVVAMVNRDHPWSKRRSVHIEEFDGQRVVLREVGSTTRLAFEHALAAANIKPRVAMEIGSREACRHAVIRGIGVGIVSEVEFVPHKLINPLPISNAEIFTYAHVACLAERRESRLVSAFITVAQQLVARGQAGSRIIPG
ncbi:MAG TPA: LysR substrate-binding domain-containing protein [Acetobacteraceae bacterium]|nr:LysR substrate-binding domain-containing protein [Acetobacteraceae bacterium]